MRAVVFTGAGGPEVVAFEERPDPAPQGDEVLVRVRYAGLNPADLAQRVGSYPAPPGVPGDIPGIEVSGEVIARGPSAREHEIGSRVFGIVGGGGLADHVLVPARHVAAVPDSLDDRAAAAVPEVFVTAHDAVISQAGLRLGEVLLVNGANGGVGTAGVQIGAIVGARVVAAVRDPALHAEIAALGATAVVTPDGVVEVVRGLGGADVVLELVGAPNVESTIACIATGGRVVVVGTGAGAEATIDLRRLMARRMSITGTTLRARPHEQKATAVQAFAREVVPHLATGRMRPLVDAVFPWEQAIAALDRLASPGKLGKVLLDFSV
jgi:NADPH:quinone reductase